MEAPDKNVLESLEAIRVQHPHVVEWLASRLENHKAALVFLAEDSQLKIAQGKAQEAHELLNFLKHPLARSPK